MTTLIHTFGGPDSRAEIFQKAAVTFWHRVRRYNQKRWGFEIKRPKEIRIIVYEGTGDIEDFLPAKITDIEALLILSGYTGLVYENPKKFLMVFQEEGIRFIQKLYKMSNFKKAVQFAVVQELNHLWECLAGKYAGSSEALRNTSYQEQVRGYGKQEHEFRALSCAVTLTGQGKKLLKDVINWRKEHGRKI